MQCFTCRKQGHIARNCRTRWMQQATFTCFKCGNKGHIARDCKKPGKRHGGYPIPVYRECPPAMVDARTVHKVPTIKSKTTKAAYITGQVNHQEVQMLLDSGASYSVVSKKHIKVQEISPGQPIQLVNADGRDFTPLGTSRMTISLGKLHISKLHIHCC